METPLTEFWEDFIKTKGAFSCAEGLALYQIVGQAEQGQFLELGSHKGRSSMCIAAAMPKVSQLFLVEPEFKDSVWANEVLGKANKWTPDNVLATGYASYSLDVIPLFKELSFCFIDSGVHDDMVMEECKMLEDRMIQGGIIAFHDYLNQFTAVERAYDYLLSTGKYSKIEINWNEIFDYLKENDLQDGELSWHQYPELPHPPNFIGALRRK